METSSIAILGTTAVAVGAYLNAKFAIAEDLRGLRNDKAWVDRLIQRTKELGNTCTLYGMFDVVDPNIEVLWFEGKTWTYGQLKKEVDALAAYLHEKGVRPNDFIAVFMTNSPEMITTILALSKLGAVAALINTNLRSTTLTHCLDVATSQVIISTPDLSEHYSGTLSHFSLNLSSFPNHPASQSSNIVSIGPKDLAVKRPTVQTAKGSPKDLSVLVFTSGTTGKPKACAIRNQHMLVVSNPLPLDTNEPSKYFPLRTYSAMPLFHGTCLFTGFTYSLGTGSTFCVARKFSASRFFRDISESRATRMLYVGELCRYLIASPPSPYDRQHQCIVANGNGLRGDIWERFRERFGIPEIREFYRSTEGVAKYDNFGFGAWAAGKIGFAGPIRRYMETDTFIVKMDPDTGEPYRHPKTGLCAKASLNEAGEAIGRIKDPSLFTEYLNNKSATDEKLLKDVFVKGDLYHRMGDLLLQDDDGWIHFHDRVGDTFRWKGENVSTSEVRDHISQLNGVQDVVVYGLKLNRYDGKAGAAAVVFNGESEDKFMSGLYKALKKTGLPSYAIPRFVRLTSEVGTGISFKQSKGDFLKKSWKESENRDGDRLYWLNGTQYQRLDGNTWQTIEDGKAKL